MEADQPTTVEPVRPETIEPGSAPPQRRRGMLGLPLRLALLMLFAITAFVVGITGYADQRITAASDERAQAMALDAADDLAQELSESGFASGPGLPTRIEGAADGLREQDPSIRSIALVVRTDDGKLDTTTWPANRDGVAEIATASLESRDVESASSGSRALGAQPILVGQAQPTAAVAVEYDTSLVAAATRTSRQRMLLGAIVGGSLLGAALLLLLRRELFQPLEEMRRVMLQIRRGATGARIGWNRGDELGAVADEFDAMVADLEAAQLELGKYVNSDPLTGLLTRSAFTDRFSGELTRARREGYPIAVVAIDIDSLEELNRTHDRAAGDQVLADLGAVVAGCTRPTDACGRTGGDSFHVALVGADAAQAAIVVDRIRREVAQRIGIGPERTRVTCGFGVAEFPQHAVDQLAIERMATSACEHAQRAGRDQALAFGASGGYVDAMSLVPESERTADQPAGARELSSTVHALARALDGIDPALGGSAHSQRVARYAAAVAREFGMSDSDLRELRSAAVLHDVGKVAVPPSILRVPEDELDERERGARRYHAWVSRTMIAGAGLPGVANSVFHLPERFDGTGYPERLREDEIPLASRILRAAELLDDLTTGQGGRAAMTPFAAAGELKLRAGTELDPDVAMRLARLVRDDGLVGNAPVVADEGVADAA